MNDLDAPAGFIDALDKVRSALAVLGEGLTIEMVVDSYIRGLNAAGFKAAHATVWVGGAKGRRRPLPFAIELDCPFGHRTEDRTDYAKTWLIIEENGGWSLSERSPCTRCSWEAVRELLANCPRCGAGEDSSRHYPDHDPIDLTGFYGHQEMDYGGKPWEFEYVEVPGGGFDASPLAWVAQDLLRRAAIARARWWLERTPEAEEWLARRIHDEDERRRVLSDELRRARETMGALPTKRAEEKPPGPDFSMPEKVAKWLEELTDADGNPAIPASAKTRAAWEVIKDMPRALRPSKNASDYAQAIRNGSRGTEA